MHGCQKNFADCKNFTVGQFHFVNLLHTVAFLCSVIYNGVHDAGPLYIEIKKITDSVDVPLNTPFVYTVFLASYALLMISPRISLV